MNRIHNDEPVINEDDIICIAVFSSRISADLAQSVLAGSGIKSLVDSDDYGGLHPPLAMTHGVRLLITRGDAEIAKELLDEGDYEDLIEIN